MKKITVLLLAVAISLCAVSSAFAAVWTEADRNEKTLIYYDSSALQYDGNTIRVYEKVIYRSEELVRKLSRGSATRVAYAIVYNEYDVKNRTYRILGAKRYDKDDNCLYTMEESSKKIAIRPGTLVDYLFNSYKEVLRIQ